MAKETRTFHNGPLLDLVAPHVEEACRQGHATACQERSAKDRLSRQGRAYRPRALVSFLLEKRLEIYTAPLIFYGRHSLKLRSMKSKFQLCRK